MLETVPFFYLKEGRKKLRCCIMTIPKESRTRVTCGLFLNTLDSESLMNHELTVFRLATLREMFFFCVQMELLITWFEQMGIFIISESSFSKQEVLGRSSSQRFERGSKAMTSLLFLSFLIDTLPA